MNHYDEELQNYEQIANDASKDYRFKQVKKQKKIKIIINKTKAIKFIKKTAFLILTAIILSNSINFFRKDIFMSKAYENFSSHYHASTDIHGYLDFCNTYNEDFQNYLESLGGKYQNMDVDYFLATYVMSKDESADIGIKLV